MTRPTDYDLAEMRRKGPVWRIVCVVDGVDEEIEGYLPGKLSRRFAVTLYRINISFRYHVKLRQVYLVEARRIG